MLKLNIKASTTVFARVFVKVWEGITWAMDFWTYSCLYKLFAVFLALHNFCVKLEANCVQPTHTPDWKGQSNFCTLLVFPQFEEFKGSWKANRIVNSDLCWAPVRAWTFPNLCCHNKRHKFCCWFWPVKPLIFLLVFFCLFRPRFQENQVKVMFWKHHSSFLHFFFFSGIVLKFFKQHTWQHL